MTTLKFSGDKTVLKDAFAKQGWQIKENIGNVSLQAKTQNGGTLNYYDSTGNILLQGNVTDSDKEVLSSLINLKTTTEEFKDKNNKKIFIVHGHDNQSKTELENMLFKWGLTPIASVDQPTNGNTIIENLLDHIKSCIYGIVLLTPDDFGYSEKDGQAAIKPRARQNVIMEMGMVLMGLGRKNVVILRKAEIEAPTDINGLIYRSYTKSVTEIKDSLRQDLKNVDISLKD